MKALLITGSRHGINLPKKEINNFLKEHIEEDIELIIHGNAEGVDSIIDQYAIDNCIQVLKMPAQWNEHGNRAGPKRNKEMVTLALCLKHCGWDITCIAIPGSNSKGTYNCLNLMKEAGLHGKVLKMGK